MQKCSLPNVITGGTHGTAAGVEGEGMVQIKMALPRPL